MITRTEDNRHLVDLEIPAQQDGDEILHLCPHCGSQFFNLQVAFVDFEMSMYFTEMECSNCGAAMKAPTPVDHPAYLPGA